jgi:putative ABC transport system permease protein
MFIPPSSLEGRKGSEDNWGFPYMVTYIQLRDGVHAGDLEKAAANLLAVNTPESIHSNLSVYFTNLRDYYAEANNGLVKKMIYTLSAVTLFILVMAIVNFVNISIGNSSSRLKEIGIRKVLGSLKGQIIGQFLAESILLALLAAILSVGFYEIFRSYFQVLLNKPVASVQYLFPYSLLVPLLMALVIGLLAGIYPAFVLSAFPSVDSMKGKLKSIKENLLFRRILMISQFSIALFVFAGAAVISQQVNYFFDKDLGFSKESLVSIAVPRDWTPAGLARMESIRDELSHLKEVRNVTLSYEIPNGNYGAGFGIYQMGQDSASAVYAQVLSTDEHYAKTYGIKMLAGQFLNEQQGVLQPNTIVINRSAVKALGFESPEKAMGQKVRIHFFPAELTITGVSSDFHFESMHQGIKPLAFLHVRGGASYRYLSLRLNPANIGKSMSAVEQKWKELMPEAPFEYTFLDETIQKLYLSELQLQKAAAIATSLSIVIVLLGLLGMVSLNVARRTREVGIRKVLGASASSVIMLFLNEFLMVMLFASVIAFPLVILTMQKWLQNYAYRINIDWGTFAWILFGFGAMITALVAMQTHKAALTNPVESLKGE